MPTPQLILACRNLGKSFVLHERGVTVPSADGVDLDVYAGRLTAVVGRSGAGKSSLLKCVYRTYLPTAGTVTYHPAAGPPLDLATADEHAVVALRRAEVSFVTQFLYCLPRQAAVDVVAWPLYELGVGRDEGRERAATLLRRLGLPEHLWSLPPATFSGGERQRVNIARGLVARPRLLLLDEPTASLDAASVERVCEVIAAEKARGCGMLAVFHDAELIDRLADVRAEVRRSADAVEMEAVAP